jgi:DNA-binding transcriptional LysR family regulator
MRNEGVVYGALTTSASDHADYSALPRNLAIMVDLTVDTGRCARLQGSASTSRCHCAPGMVSHMRGDPYGAIVGQQVRHSPLRDPPPCRSGRTAAGADGCRAPTAISGLPIAYLSAHTMAQRAAVIADLAVAPLPRSYLTDDMTALGSKQGLPDLGSFEVRLLTGPETSETIRAVADSVRFAFSEMIGIAA